MGHIKHDFIIVTSAFLEELEQANKKAKEIFSGSATGIMANYSSIVGEITQSIINDISSFTIATDGSNDGWSEKEIANKMRNEFIGFLESNLRCEFAFIRFGGDDNVVVIKTS